MIATCGRGLRRLSLLAALAICIWLPDALSQQAASNRLHGGADLTLSSGYVWRGYVHNDDFVIQPDFYLTYRNFLASVWASLDTTDREDIGIESKGDFSEIDFVLQYTIPTRLVDLSLGCSFYDYPNTPDDLRESTQEFYAKGSFNVLLDPSIELFYDVDEVEGWYGRVSATYAQPQGALDWKLRASLGFASEEFCNYYFSGRDDVFGSSKFCDLELKFSTTFDLGLNFGLTPFVAFSYLLESSLRDAYDDNGEFYGGATLFWTF